MSASHRLFAGEVERAEKLRPAATITASALRQVEAEHADKLAMCRLCERYGAGGVCADLSGDCGCGGVTVRMHIHRNGKCPRKIWG